MTKMATTPTYVLNLKHIVLNNKKVLWSWTWNATSWDQALQSVYKWSPWVDDLFHGKVKFCRAWV